jgi:hypothetical protein
MSRIPRITGTDLIAALAKPASAFSVSKAAIISCATRMAEAPWYLHTQVRPSVPVCFTRSFEIAN